eukprot:753985-Hanusia_phi.AAC.8
MSRAARFAPDGAQQQEALPSSDALLCGGSFQRRGPEFTSQSLPMSVRPLLCVSCSIQHGEPLGGLLARVRGEVEGSVTWEVILKLPWSLHLISLRPLAFHTQRPSMPLLAHLPALPPLGS